MAGCHALAGENVPKVTVPCILDLLDVSFNDCLSLADLYARQTYVLSQVYRWHKPELCFAFRVRHVDVNPRLLAGEEEQSELAVAEDGGRHMRTVADCRGVAGGAAAPWLFSPRRRR